MTLHDEADTSLLLTGDEVPPVLEENAQSASPFFFATVDGHSLSLSAPSPADFGGPSLLLELLH